MNDFQIQGLDAGSAAVPLIIKDAQKMRAEALRDAVRAIVGLFAGSAPKTA